MAKRISSSTVNWSLINEYLPQDVAAFRAFKAKTDKYLSRLASQPAELPQIDWAYYKSKISMPGMVDTYKNSYAALKIPYPTDQGLLAKVKEQQAKFINERNIQVEKSAKEIATIKEELKQLEECIPYSEMNLEEFYVARPDIAIDVNKPTFWPKGAWNEGSKFKA